MNPIITIGMDNTGKTTLQEGIIKDYKEFIEKTKQTIDSVPEMFREEVIKITNQTVEAIKSPGPLNRIDMHNWCYDNIKQFNAEADKLKVYDRFGCITEQIYAPIVRKNPNTDHVQFLEEYLHICTYEEAPFFIYARPSKEDILGFADGREQMEGVKENGSELLAAYDELYFRMLTSGKFIVTPFNYKTDEIKEVLSAYMSFKAGQTRKALHYNIEESVAASLHNGPELIEVFKEAESMIIRDIEKIRVMMLSVRTVIVEIKNVWRALELQKGSLEKEIEDKLLIVQQNLVIFENELNKIYLGLL